MLSIGKRPDGTPKDTLANITERDRFVVHIAHSSQLETLNASAASLPSGESEVSQLQMQTCPFDRFGLPRLADAPVAYACERYRIDHIGNQDQALVFGRIRAIYLDDTIVEQQENGRITVDNDKLDPLARLGADEYLASGKVIRRTRPD
jgi:flavin reductase (DIM6/NTAB) family NADH-FMN oxidoreductase RutF